MAQFSDDGQWWWDGTRWIATSQVVIPDLMVARPAETTKSMQSDRKLGEATTIAEWVVFGSSKGAFPALVVGTWFIFHERAAFRKFRQWTLAQLASATEHLMGPGEPMVAGETTLYRPYSFIAVQAPFRDLAIVVTAAHVLILRFDRFDGQPRWVAAAARARDVRIVASGEFLRARPVIVVHHGGHTWTIQGTPRVMQEKPVLAAWRAALAAR